MSPQVVNFFYFVAALCFILGIKGMTDPKTARLGNIISAVGMTVAVIDKATRTNSSFSCFWRSCSFFGWYSRVL